MDLEELNKKKQQNISLILLNKTHKYNKNSIIIKTSKITKPLKFYLFSFYVLIRYFFAKRTTCGYEKYFVGFVCSEY